MVHSLVRSSSKFEKGEDNGDGGGGRRKRGTKEIQVTCWTHTAMQVLVLCFFMTVRLVIFVAFHPVTHEKEREGEFAPALKRERERERERDGFLVDFRTETVLQNTTDGPSSSWSCEPKWLPYWWGQEEPRLLLPMELRPFFNFTTSIRTNLKILVMGDSVGIQLSQYLQKVVLEGSSSSSSSSSSRHNNNNHHANTAVLKTAFRAGRGDPAIHVAAPLLPEDNENENSNTTTTATMTTGSGAIAGWRVTGMFLPDALNWAPANYNRGWNLEDVAALRAFVSNATTISSSVSVSSSSSPTTTTRALTKNVTLGLDQKNYVVSASPVGNFDVFVFRIPSPAWTKLGEVTEETLRRVLTLAHQLFGVQVVVFTSMHYCNNIRNQQEQEEMERRNRMVFHFAQNWTQTHHNNNNQKGGGGGGGIHTVYVLDVGRLSDELMAWNARLLGFDTVTNNYLDNKLGGNSKSSFRFTIGHICGEKVSHNSSTCVRNAITHDGMHLCMNIVGPRIAAGLACQLRCAYHPDRSTNAAVVTRDDPSLSSSSSSCAEACNDHYMNATTMVY